jgi:hypothetical protein
LSKKCNYYIDIILLKCYIVIVRRENMEIFCLRINSELYAKLKLEASNEDRSINGMLLYIIKKYFENK